MKVSRQDWIKVLCALSAGSFLISFVQGWLGIQLIYFVFLIFALVFFFVVWHKKESKIIDMDKANENAMAMLQKMGMISDSGAEMERGFKVSDNKRFSSYGKVWDLEYKGNPSRIAVLVDAKTGKIVGTDFRAPPRESPIQMGWKEPTYMYPSPGRIKRKIEEEVKTS